MQRTVLLFSLLASAMLTTACSSQRTTTLPDGTVATRIDCTSSTSGLNFCFEKAGKSCGAEGYTIVSPQGEVLGSSAVAGTEPAALVRGFDGNAASILIKCGTPDDS